MHSLTPRWPDAFRCYLVTRLLFPVLPAERGHRVPEDVARLYFRDMCRVGGQLPCCRSCTSQCEGLPKRHLLLSLQTLQLTELPPNLSSQALDYLHFRQRVVHGDLKPENALMGASGRIALSDFGCRQGSVWVSCLRSLQVR